MERRLENRIAIVTGSTSGIGAAIATMMAAQGASVIVSGRRREHGEAVVRQIESAGGRAIFHEADVADVAQCTALCDRAVEEYGAIDVLVNNAGIFPLITFEETTPEQWDQIFAVNARSAFFCSQAAVPHMRTRGGGAIINIGSSHPYGAGREQFVYGVSKGALLTLTRKLSLLLAPDLIRVNWITVGWVLTEQERKMRNIPEDDTAFVEEHARHNPLGEFTTVEDIAEACVYLASDEGVHVTGTAIAASSGLGINI